MNNPVDANTSNWQTTVTDSEIPVMVDFWAPWCGPCVMIAPTVRELADHYEGKLNVVKLNVDDEPQIASRYGVRSIPALIFFKNGQPVHQIIGAQPKPTLQRAIDSLLGA